MFESLKKFCDSFLDCGVPGFDIAVYKDGECIFRHWNGYNDLENKIKMNGKERYNIYSCSKPITCTAALQLWEKGLFSLEDKLSDYMPCFENMTVQTENGIVAAKSPILIKHLFEMTAGFSYDVNSKSLIECREETGGRCPTTETMRYLAKEPLLFEPGDRWNYSFCHDVLAALVEVISGEKFEDYVRKNIFDVLGMKDSTFMLPESEFETIAQQYSFWEDGPRNIGKSIGGYKFGSEYASGGAGAVSTVDDYMKFLEGLRTNKLLKPETLKLMITDRLTEQQKRTYTAREKYGYGLGVRCPAGKGTYTDFGWGGAAGAHLAVDMEYGISIYLAMHLTGSPVQGVRSLVYRFVKAELFGTESLEDIQKQLKTIHNYNLTY